MQARLEQTPDAMRIRRSTVEHPYATIKAWMGATHFLTKGLERVKAEMSVHVLAYNFRRLIAILGIEKMLAAIRAYARFLTLQALLEVVSVLVFLKSQMGLRGLERFFIFRPGLCPYNSASSPTF